MRKIHILLMFLLIFQFAKSQTREIRLLNTNWNFAYDSEVKPAVWQWVEIPHTWNRDDSMTGNINYYRGAATYEKKIFIEKKLEGKRLFLKFDGVNTVANVFINGRHIGEHRGGYTSFIFEITDKVTYGEDNALRVRVSNALQLDVMPLVGDFNFYGGIYRDVNLVITDKSCISLLNYGSPGVYLEQVEVSKQRAEVNAKILISNGDSTVGNYMLNVNVIDDSQVVVSKTIAFTVGAKSQIMASLPFTLKTPRLWNGRKDPFIYNVVVSLLQNGTLVDRVEQPLGLRYFTVDPDKGFFLNGEHLQLRGVCRHQDRSEQGNALSRENEEEDVAILMEMGANAIRLSHYPQSPYFYDLLDKNGIVTWSEIPFVGPGGYRGQGFVNQFSFRENGKQQLLEMIRQNYNHPGICFWGLYNELKTDGDNPLEYVKELNNISKIEDPSRLTTCANMGSGLQDSIANLSCWNLYFGWYGGKPEEIGQWTDQKHKEFPNYRIGVSEYGAGASIFQHEEGLVQPSPTSFWHPESWQAYYHERNWKAINERPYIWGSFIWNLFDFAAAHRTEGDRPGRNDKGLVTFDRKVKKDAWWFYKANWNESDPVLYIADRRFVNRTVTQTAVKVYSNLREVELFVNGVSFGKSRGTYSTFVWNNVILRKGENLIEVKSEKDGRKYSDMCNWFLEK